MKNIRILCAGDRNNYGDLLFPIVLAKFLEEHGIALSNYGLVRSDLSGYGALRTRSFRDLERDISQGDSLVIGGGEVLFPTWTRLYSYISPVFDRFLTKSGTFESAESKLKLSKKLLSSGNHVFPFTPYFEGVKAYYNSVGGVGVGDLSADERAYVQKILPTAEIVSVRDNATRNDLLDIVGDVSVVPDSAVLMSDYFPKNDLRKVVRSSVAEIADESYIFFQCSKKLKPNYALFSKTLGALSKNLGVRVVLCPIGLASGHEDHVALQRMASEDTSFILMKPQSLFEVMYLIANARVYMGTSLHGLITAISYEVPFIPLNPNVGKMTRYCETWTKSTGVDRCFDYASDWVEFYQRICDWEMSASIDLAGAQKSLVYENFHNFIGV